MRSLITGIGGFIGSYLADYLLDQGHEVHGIVRRPSPLLATEREALTLHTGNVADGEFVKRILEETRPDTVYHLAAQSLPEVSWREPAATVEVNIHGTINVLEAIRTLSAKPRLMVACSCSEYAVVADGKPVGEDARLDPSSLYGVTKLAVDQLSDLYGQRYALPIIRARPFFLIGPRKDGDVSSDLAKRIVAIERGEANDLPVGRLDVVRDFLDVRDGVRAMALVAERGDVGDVYNICLGKGFRIHDVLETLKKLSRVEVAEQINPDLLRPIDEPIKVGDPGKLKALGWAPEYELAATLGDILAYWRGRPSST